MARPGAFLISLLRASERSHRVLTHKGYPRPLAHSQALLPGSGFTSKHKEGVGAQNEYFN
jgi:hypothetical protein